MYNPLYNDTVTIFCRYESRLGDTWYPTVLRNVDLNMDKAAIIAKYSAESQDNAVLNIHYKIEDLADGENYEYKQIPRLKGKKLIVGGKVWLPAKDWDRQVNDMLPNTLTFTDGQKFDFFYVGEWPNENPISDDDYLDDFYNHMKKNYDYVFAITSVAFYSVIPHFEIMGK